MDRKASDRSLTHLSFMKANMRDRAIFQSYPIQTLNLQPIFPTQSLPKARFRNQTAVPAGYKSVSFHTCRQPLIISKTFTCPA